MSVLGAMAATLAEPLTDLVDDLFTSDEERAAAKAKLQSQEFRHKLRVVAQRMSVMQAEAKSRDPWTSRARPSFLYVVYLYILAGIPYGVVFALWPGAAISVTDGVRAWLEAIPEEMWWLFGTGYLGYNVARSADKRAFLRRLAGDNSERKFLD